MEDNKINFVGRQRAFFNKIENSGVSNRWINLSLYVKDVVCSIVISLSIKETPCIIEINAHSKSRFNFKFRFPYKNSVSLNSFPSSGKFSSTRYCISGFRKKSS
jgi:hypothetical protein